MAIEGLRSDGEVQPSGSYAEDSEVLTEDEDFENIFDAPYITVNRISGRYQAEVILSGNDILDQDRIQTALDVGAVHGVRAYANVQGTYGNVLIHFTEKSGVEERMIRAGHLDY